MKALVKKKNKGTLVAALSRSVMPYVGRGILAEFDARHSPYAYPTEDEVRYQLRNQNPEDFRGAAHCAIIRDIQKLTEAGGWFTGRSGYDPSTEQRLDAVEVVDLALTDTDTQELAPAAEGV